eukprot:7115344-Ditylum_brightwellii.AAC.1
MFGSLSSHNEVKSPVPRNKKADHLPFGIYQWARSMGLSYGTPDRYPEHSGLELDTIITV